MMTATHPVAQRYLAELERALRDLPSARRREIVDDVRAHIAEAASGNADEATLRNVLDDLGDPDVIAAEARDRFGSQSLSKPGLTEAFALAALLVGGIVVPLAGWVIGVVLLWMSRAWSTRDKVVGTFILPGGLALPVYLYVFAPFGIPYCVTTPDPPGRRIEGVTACGTEPLTSEWWGVALLLIVALAPIITTIYLGRRAWSRG